MKKVFKFGCLTIIVLIVLGIIIGALSGGEEEKDKEEAVTTSTEPKETNKDSESTEPKEEKEDKEEATTVGIGQPLQVGDVVFTVREIGEETKLGDEFFSEEPSEGAVYKMVYVTVENKGKEKLMMDSNYFKLLVDDVEYSPFTSTALIDEMLFLEEINPNIKKEGTLIFEVPAGTKGTQLHVQTGLFGTETGVINLD